MLMQRKWPRVGERVRVLMPVPDGGIYRWPGTAIIVNRRATRWDDAGVFVALDDKPSGYWFDISVIQLEGKS